jgi:RNA polymerase sigma-70 factor (ECF subfamily)
MELASESEPAAAALAALDVEARAAARGDRAAFERLYRGTIARVHTLARRMLGAARADEASQEVYLRAWQHLASWRGDAAATTWLHRVALNVVLDLAARAAPDTEGGARLDELASPVAHPGWTLDLEEALARLPHGARRVFVLHDVEGLAHAEMAQRLGLAPGTSKSQLHRARMLLRAHLAGGRTE